MLLACLMAFTSFSVITVNAQAENDSQEEIVEPEDLEVSAEQQENVARSSGPNMLIEVGVDANGNPQLPRAFSYDAKPELLTYVKRGDIIYEPRAGQFVEDLIYVGHIAIVLDVVYDSTYDQEYVLLLEAFAPGVRYGILYPERFDQNQAEVKRFTNISDYVIESAITWALTQYGKPYSIKPTKNASANNGHWYCSELIWAAFYHQGYELDPNAEGESDNTIVYPAELAAYPYLTDILKYGETTTVTIENTNYHRTTCGTDVYSETHDYTMIDSCYGICEYCGYSTLVNAHSYTYNCLPTGATYHRAYCECGETIVREHNFEVDGTTRTCTECNYKAIVPHTHSYTMYSPCKDGKNHVAKCSCGYEKTQPCVGQAQQDGINRCQLCGWIISGTGIGGIFSNEDEYPTNSLGYVPMIQSIENVYYALI